MNPATIQKPTEFVLLSIVSEIGLATHYITNDRNLANRCWDGEYGEILLFSETLTESQIIEVEDFIKCRYGNKVEFEEDIVLGVDDPCENIAVAAPAEFDTYLWSNGDEVPETSVSGMGVHWLEGSSSFNYITRDTLEVRFDANVIPAQNILCLGDSLPWNLNLHPDFEVEWSDGATGSERAITEGGAYYADITNNQGCTWRTPTVQVTIDPYPAVPAIEAEDNFCQGNEIFLGAGFEETLSYLWSTGETSAFITPQEPGIYTVETANANGCTARDTIDLEFAGTAPVPTADIPPLCQNTEVTLTDTTVPEDAEITEWSWNVGGISGSDPFFQTVFEEMAAVPVSLTVTLDNGCTGTLRDTLDVRPQPEVNFSDPVVCAGSPAFFEDLSTVDGPAFVAERLWTFSNGETDTGPVGQTVFESLGVETVNLSVTSTEGCAGDETRTVEVLGSPAADFTPQDVCAGTPVVFQEDVDTSESGPVFYNWQFGDGFFSNFPNTSHTYAQPGTYQVTLTATGNNLGQQGCVSSVARTVRVFPPPIAAASAEDACTGTPSLLTDLTVPAVLSGEEDPVISRTWTVNGTPAGNAQETSFIPEAADIEYNVQLNVTTEAGCTASATASFSAAEIPEADFSLTIPELSPPFTAVPENNTSDAENFVWLIDGTAVSTDFEPELLFPETGTYTVTLAAVNDLGCNDTLSLSKTVIDPQYNLSLLGIETSEAGGELEVAAVIRNGSNVPVRSFDYRLQVGADVNFKARAEFLIQPGETVLWPAEYVFALTPGGTLPYTCLTVSNPNGILDLSPPLSETDTTDNSRCVALNRPGPTFAPPYPNPSSDAFKLGIIMPEADRLTLTMIDASGRETRRAAWDLPSGFTVIDWPLEGIMSGVYLLKYETAGIVHTERVVVGR